MPQNYSQRRVKHQQVSHIRLSAEQIADNQTWNQRFQKVSKEYGGAGLHSHDTQHVGTAGVAAPLFPDVHMVHPAVNISGL